MHLPYDNFLQYLDKNPLLSIKDARNPFDAFEEQLRSLFAQDPTNCLIQDNLTNLIDLYNSKNPEVRYRDAYYIDNPQQIVFPLQNHKPAGELAIVPSLRNFGDNFNIFTDHAFTNWGKAEWSNIVVAGSAVSKCLEPIPDAVKHLGGNVIRQYYLESPGTPSDIDIFMYGISDQNIAVSRIVDIVSRLNRVGTTVSIRTLNCVTVVAPHPQRYIQIVFRLYRTLSEIVTGCDLDCCCLAYDRSRVFASPRA